MAQLSPEFLARVIDRWQVLETRAAQPTVIDGDTFIRIGVQMKEKDQTILLLTEKSETQQQQIEDQQPKVLYADSVTTSKSSILIGEPAKLICQNGVQIGTGRLFKYLRDNGWLIKRHGSDWIMPTQYSMERKLFEIKERSINNGNGSVRLTKTLHGRNKCKRLKS